MIITTVDEHLVNEVKSLERLIGNTPLIEIKHLNSNKDVRVLGKAEWLQFGGSVKSRPAFSIIKEAVLEGKINRERGLLDASSGNTAIAYAAIGSRLEVPVTICLPENASKERKLLLKAHGTRVVLTSPFGGTDEAQDKAVEILNKAPEKYYYADQYNNPNNWKAHFDKTGIEIWEQTQGEITHFVTGLGTTGSFTGVSRKIKSLNENIQCIALQPESAMHGMEGWKHLETAKVPGIYDSKLANEIHEIDTGEAYDMIVKAARHEGLMLSPSAAANLVGALKVAESIDKGTVVTLLPDNAEKYGEIIRDLL